MNELAEFRTGKNEFFRDSHHSPLPHHRRHGFDGLDYYPANDELVFTLPVEPGDGTELRIATTDGDERVYRRAGLIEFTVDDQPVRLALYDTGQPGYFLPFRDATSGDETYGAGRYLDLEPNHDGTVTIDFNYAYNPFCAYDEAYSCPLPPPENWLKVPVRAGEKDFQG